MVLLRTQLIVALSCLIILTAKFKKRIPLWVASSYSIYCHHYCYHHHLADNIVVLNLTSLGQLNACLLQQTTLWNVLHTASCLTCVIAHALNDKNNLYQQTDIFVRTKDAHGEFCIRHAPSRGCPVRLRNGDDGRSGSQLKPDQVASSSCTFMLTINFFLVL